MPRSQALRCRLWRVNGVLALLLLALGVRVALGPVGESPPLPDMSYDWAEVGRRVDHPPVTLEEYREMRARYAPRGGALESRQPVVAAHDASTEPTLAAYEVRMWIHRPGEPDLVALRCKDPAHPSWFFPIEGRPHEDVELRGIEVENAVAHISVSRGEESFTYRFPLEARLDPRIARVTPHKAPWAPNPRVDGTRVVQEESACIALQGLKCVPFYGADGQVEGLRVTGVQPGSRFDRMGLRRQDIVLRCGEAPATRRATLARETASDASITIRRMARDGSIELSFRDA